MNTLKQYTTKQLEMELERRKMPKLVAGPYTSPVGVWHVTTEGDCEGKSIKDLSVHQGHIVDIARKLSAHAYYELHFSPGANAPAEIEPRPTVTIGLDITSGTWELTPDERVACIGEFFRRKPAFADYHFNGNTSYAGVGLSFK